MESLICPKDNKTTARVSKNHSELIISVKRGENGVTQIYLPISATGTVHCYMGDTTKFVFNYGTIGTIVA